MEKLVLKTDTPSDDQELGGAAQNLRMVEALLFAAAEPLDDQSLAARLPDGVDVPALMLELSVRYEGRGVNLVRVGGKWAFRTAPDLAFLLEKERTTVRRLSKAALETLAIVAYHQPVTRAEIEEIRGVGISRGTLDMLLEVGWVRLRGRRRTPGRPVTFGTTEEFLDHFGLEGLDDLPGVGELKKSGLLRAEPPTSLFPRRDENAEPEDTEPDHMEPEGSESERTEPDDVAAGPQVIESTPAFEEVDEGEVQSAVTGEVAEALAMAGGSRAEAPPQRVSSRHERLAERTLVGTAEPDTD